MPRERILKAADLRDAVASEQLGWRVAEQLGPQERIPVHGIGAETKALKPAAKVGRVDFAKVFAVAPMNPYLVERARKHKFLKTTVKPLLEPAPKKRGPTP